MVISVVVSSTVTVGGATMPYFEWEINEGSHGSLTTATIRTSISRLRREGIDIINMSQGLQVPAVLIAVSSGDNKDKRVFLGALDTTDWDMDNDVLEIHCLDNAAPLIDSKKTLSNYKLTNQTASQLVTQIAQDFGYKTNKIQVPNPNPLIGVVFNQQSNWSSYPQPIWSVLQALARQCGFECKVTVFNELYFGPQSDEQTTGIKCAWKKSPQTKDDASVPMRSFHIKHQPRRNKTFTVLVTSHHRKTGQSYKGEAVSNGVPQTSVTGAVVGQKIKSGLFVGSSGGRARNLLSQSLDGKPVYVINKDGLTQDQCQALASAKAKDIAKREMIITFCIDGYPGQLSNAPVAVVDYSPDGELDGFNLQEMIISAATHRYRMPQGGSGEGYTTELTAMNLPSTQESI